MREFIQVALMELSRDIRQEWTPFLMTLNRYIFVDVYRLFVP